jgi:hypothetical protein
MQMYNIMSRVSLSQRLINLLYSISPVHLFPSLSSAPCGHLMETRAIETSIGKGHQQQKWTLTLY